jgi:hypothetical protein
LLFSLLQFFHKLLPFREFFFYFCFFLTTRVIFFLWGGTPPGEVWGGQDDAPSVRGEAHGKVRQEVKTFFFKFIILLIFDQKKRRKWSKIGLKGRLNNCEAAFRNNF